MNYTIYSDGSDFKKTSHRLGIGGLIIDSDGNVLGTLGKEISREYMKFKYRTDDCSNPTMELLAALECLKEFKGIPEKGSQVVLKADYMGVSKWLDPKNPWKTTKPYISKIKDEIQSLLRTLPFSVSFEWVPGHQKVTPGDAYWNNEVDKLAKGQ